MPGKLYLVPTPLDFGCAVQEPIVDSVPDGTLRAASRLAHWITENAKSTRAFLQRVGEVHPLAQPVQALAIVELPRQVHKKGDHAGGFDAAPLLQAALQGHDMALASEAGLPAVADPGSSVVKAAHALGIDVVPLSGPVSLVLALAASGLNGQNFAFVGYVPQEPAQRAARIRELESLAMRTGQTQLFIETPYRNAALWQALVETLKPPTRLAIAAGLTLQAPVTRCRTAGEWRGTPCPAGDRPAVFLLGI